MLSGESAIFRKLWLELPALCSDASGGGAGGRVGRMLGLEMALVLGHSHEIVENGKRAVLYL